MIREENVGYCCGFMYERPDIDEMGRKSWKEARACLVGIVEVRGLLCA